MPFQVAMAKLKVAGFQALILLLSLALGIPAQPMPTANPAYDLISIRPSDFQPQVSGMQLMPDGGLLVMTHEPVRANPVKPGSLYLLRGVQGGDASQVTVRKIINGTFSGTGMLLHDGTLYIAEKNRLIEILSLDQGEIALDQAKDSVPGQYRTIHKYGWDNNYHQYAFGPLFSDGYFYVALSTAWTENLNKSKNRAALLKISKATGQAEIILSGIRTPNGLAFAPDGEIFAADNQGGWLPSSKLNNLRPGRFYGFFNNAGGLFDRVTPSPPALWLPHGEISNSPTSPTFLKQGPYAGHVVMGDLFYGGLQRAFLEKVNGEYQGAVFKFSGGLEAAVNQIVEAPDGTLYLGEMGSQHCSCWLWPGGRLFGLQKLRPSNRPVFDFLAVRSLGRTSMELQFSEPIDASAAVVSNFEVRSWSYNPTSSYGGPKVGNSLLTVRSAAPSSKGDAVLLEIDGLTTGKVVHFKIRAMASKSGRPLWNSQAWYTLNQFGPGEAVNTRFDGKGRNSGHPGMPFAAWDAAGLHLASPTEAPWRLEIRDAMGRDLHTYRGESRVSTIVVPASRYSPGIYLLNIISPAGQYSQRIAHY